MSVRKTMNALLDCFCLYNKNLLWLWCGLVLKTDLIFVELLQPSSVNSVVFLNLKLLNEELHFFGSHYLANKVIVAIVMVKTAFVVAWKYKILSDVMFPGEKLLPCQINLDHAPKGRNILAVWPYVCIRTRHVFVWIYLPMRYKCTGWQH